MIRSKKRNWLALGVTIALAGSCATMQVTPERYFARKGKNNGFVSLWMPLATERAQTAYAHTLNGFPRTGSDCIAGCPKVDIWQYQFRPNLKQTLTSTKPISSQKEYWKATNEARIVSISLFGSNPMYVEGLLDYIKSFKHLKEANHITDPLWGYETFTVRVYIGKRNPFQRAVLGELAGETSDAIIERLLAAGCEVAFVDNGLAKIGKDGTFWRFMVAGEQMPEGQRIRYLLRDADTILSAGEAFSVGEWIAGGKSFHRMHVLPVCLGPLTASIWGGSHIGKGHFSDMKTMIEYFPYRLKYGDDELFTRDMIWSRIKYIGSVTTHLYPRGVVHALANPYRGSCEEPTQVFCDHARKGGTCEDVFVPDNIQSPWRALGLRGTLEQLKKRPEGFNLHLETERGRAAYEALRI